MQEVSLLQLVYKHYHLFNSDDIRKEYEYEILLNDLSTFNPEMLDKQRVLAIAKSDMLDQELMDEIEPTLPANVPHVFISSITGMGLSVLKDILWEELNKNSNKKRKQSREHCPTCQRHELSAERTEKGRDEISCNPLFGKSPTRYVTPSTVGISNNLP